MWTFIPMIEIRNPKTNPDRDIDADADVFSG
jgi:hypothetical protein